MLSVHAYHSSLCWRRYSGGLTWTLSPSLIACLALILMVRVGGVVLAHMDA